MIYRMDGKGLMNGFDTHISPEEKEIVVFHPAQILPRYIITFELRPPISRTEES